MQRNSFIKELEGGYSANSSMMAKELKFRILTKCSHINDLVHLEGSFVRCDFCMVLAFVLQKKKVTVPGVLL